MLTKRIIPCLDVKNNQVVKGIRFDNHNIVGDILTLAKQYCEQGADELVFYDITASAEQRSIEPAWISKVAKTLNIPFCVAGGIRSVQQAAAILAAGADKISINSPALENPNLINKLVKTFGSQCIVIGIDSFQQGNNYYVYQYTGSSKTIRATDRCTLDWLAEVQERGAGEIVLNCMNQDGVRQGYDLQQVNFLQKAIKVPLIISGGAGKVQHFKAALQQNYISGALAASVFHSGEININQLKQTLRQQNITVRIS